MELEKTISIIIPAYNVQDYISQCLESLMHQTYSNIEIIIINDGSKDNTLEIIKKYAQLDKRIRIIDQENKGVSESRNEGLKNATGDYIMFCDSDDWYENNACEIALKSILSNDYDIAMFGYFREYPDKSLPKAMFDEEEISFEREEILQKLHRRIFGPYEKETATPEKLNAITTIWSKIYKTELIKGIYFENLKELGLCEDGYFNISAFGKAKKVLFQKLYLYHYRKIIMGGSLTQTQETDFWGRERLFYHNLHQRIQQDGLDDTYEIALNNRMTIALIEVGLNIIRFRKDSYQHLKALVCSDEYQSYCKNFDLQYLPLHWKVFFWSVIHKKTRIIYILLKVINILSSKK